MSEVSTRIVPRCSVVEISVPNPTVWAEIGKALAVCRQELEEHGRDPSYDDAVHVRATDEEIIFWFEDC